MTLPMSEPRCCGEPMVHNSFTNMYECASAYFALADEGFDEGVLTRTTAEDVGGVLAPTLAHWRASWIPDGYEEFADVDPA